MKNHCAIKNDVVRSRGGAVVCPKPRRVGLLSGAANAPCRPSALHLCHPSENSDSKAGSELLDIILAKGGPGFERFGTNNKNSKTQVASSSPPFYSGSPPSRVSNPLIQDARFGEHKFVQFLQSSPSSSPISPTQRKGGCVRPNFGNKPSVRVEGFDCLDRDRNRNCSIPTLA